MRELAVDEYCYVAGGDEDPYLNCGTNSTTVQGNGYEVSWGPGLVGLTISGTFNNVLDWATHLPEAMVAIAGQIGNLVGNILADIAQAAVEFLRSLGFELRNDVT